MTFPKARLVVSLGLFLAWLGFLSHLVYERNSIILSRPQLAVARAIVIVDVKEGESHVQVKEIAWPVEAAERVTIPKELVLPELLSCGKEQGYLGPGEYVIPLVNRGGVFQIAPVQTPGVSRSVSHATLRIGALGRHPEAVLKRLARYSRDKPGHAEGLLEPLVVPMVECVFAQMIEPYLLPEVVGNPIRTTPVELPRHLPIGDATTLDKELIELGADVKISRWEELRIYPLTGQTRAQLDEMLASRQRKRGE